jgi:hypothetical protein
MQQEKKVKTLISLILIMLVTTSFSIAQSNEETDSRLLAKAEIENSADRNIFTDGEGPNDISLLVKNTNHPLLRLKTFLWLCRAQTREP